MKTQRPVPVDVESISGFYQQGISRYGADTTRAACWSSAERAQQGYDVMSQASGQDWLRIQSVLDVGSGQGNLLRFLRQRRRYQGRYVGIELLSEFHEVAIRQNGGDDHAEFLCAEFLGHDFGSECFDWVLSFGSLSVVQPCQSEYDTASIEKMALSRCGFSLYLNDVAKMENIPPGLATHDIHALCREIVEKWPHAEFEVIPFPTDQAYQTVVHVHRTS